MRAYLIDTNHAGAWEREDPLFMARFSTKPPEDLIWVCPIVVAELEWGLRKADGGDPKRRAASRDFIENTLLGDVHPIEETTRFTYADILEAIWKLHPPPVGRDTKKHLAHLKVDVNDLWIAAVALERNLTVLTTDKMEVIRECVPALKFQNWLDPAPSAP